MSTKLTKLHEPLHRFSMDLANAIEANDAFGQQLIKLKLRKRRTEANGIFRQVRAVVEAVKADGGSLSEARAWTAQAIRWTQNGKAIDPKFARYELDTSAIKAMDSLLRLLADLPPDMIQPVTTPTPVPTPSTPPASSSTFGAKTSPFNKPPPPKPPLPSNAPNPFRTGLFGSRSAFGSSDPTPPYVVACFEALAVTADLSTADVSWLEMLATASAASSPTPADPPDAAEPAPWPTDIKGLLERLMHTDNETERGETIQRIGALNDRRALDFFYNLTRGTDAEARLLDLFAGLGGDVGLAGLLSLLPLKAEQRATWLSAAVTCVERAAERNTPLNEASLRVLWAVATAESDSGIAFCSAALDLVAALNHPESAAILWRYARSDEVNQRRAALHGLLRINPGAWLTDLLTAWADLPPAAPFPFGPTPKNLRVCIPFERLEAAIMGALPKLAASALSLISYLDDPRVVPLLAAQLGRSIPAIHEVALSQLCRLKATSATDAVATLLDPAHNEDDALRLRAADALCDWGDARGVEVVLRHVESLSKVPSLETFIQRLAPLDYPAVERWIVNSLPSLIGKSAEADELKLLELINAVVNTEPRLAQPVLEKLVGLSSKTIRMSVALALARIDSAWTHITIRQLVTDPAAQVAYHAASGCTDRAFAGQLLASSNEPMRALGVRVLYTLKDSAALIDCLTDKSAAVCALAVTALAELHALDSVEALRRLVSQTDRLDAWGQNLAVLAWRALARMDALATPEAV